MPNKIVESWIWQRARERCLRRIENDGTANQIGGFVIEHDKFILILLLIYIIYILKLKNVVTTETSILHF